MFIKSLYGSIYYKDFGPREAPAIIFSHGVGMDHRTFEQQANAFRATHRVVLWDMPGHGYSTLSNYHKSYTMLTSECLEHLMDELGINEAILVGQSLGSFVIQRFILKNPNRVLATIHIGGAKLTRYVGAWGKALVPIVVGSTHLIPKGMFYRSFGRHKADTRETQDYLTEVTRQTGKKLIIDITRDLLYDLMEGAPEQPELPILIIYGSNDLGFIRRNSLKWHKERPDSQCYEIIGANHIANQDRPEEFNYVMGRYLERLFSAEKIVRYA